MKTVCPKGRVGSNPTLSVNNHCRWQDELLYMKYRVVKTGHLGEVPKLAEGAPLERE